MSAGGQFGSTVSRAEAVAMPVVVPVASIVLAPPELPGGL